MLKKKDIHSIFALHKRVHEEERQPLISQDLTNKLYKVSLKSAQRAGKYLLKRFRRNDLKIKKDLRHDVKLDVDIETENIIVETIRKQFPDHGFLCEEGGRQISETGNYWVIDPLDGTVNFFRGIPHFCTSIAFKQKDTYVVGVVFDPVRNELFSGIRGNGAYLNNVPITHPDIEKVEDAVVIGGFFKTESLDDGRMFFEKIAQKVKKIRFFGSAALDLCYLACGRVNAYVQHGVNEWDIAAAALIAELTGVRIEITTKADKLNVLAADRKIFDTLKEYEP
jgi:myo-inositol-1(or 4)-monophosphatase